MRVRRRAPCRSRFTNSCEWSMLGAAEKMSPLERLPRPRKLGSSPGGGNRGMSEEG